MTDHEIKHIHPTFFSLEDGLPTLWDHQVRDDVKPAVCLIATDGRVEIHTDPEIVEAFLG